MAGKVHGIHFFLLYEHNFVTEPETHWLQSDSVLKQLCYLLIWGKSLHLPGPQVRKD